MDHTESSPQLNISATLRHQFCSCGNELNFMKVAKAQKTYKLGKQEIVTLQSLNFPSV